eukprot:gene11114-12112_t
MGGFSSKASVARLQKDEEEIVKLMFPIYYDDKPLAKDVEALVERTWGLILTDTAPGYLLKKEKPGFCHSSSITYFSQLFYSRLFDVHPGSKDLFKNLKKQGQFLVKMISVALSEKADRHRYHTTLTRLAEVHNERGVKAVEFFSLG